METKISVSQQYGSDDVAVTWSWTQFHTIVLEVTGKLGRWKQAADPELTCHILD